MIGGQFVELYLGFTIGVAFSLVGPVEADKVFCTPIDVFGCPYFRLSPLECECLVCTRYLVGKPAFQSGRCADGVP